MERPNSIYVSYEVRKALRLLAKARVDEKQTADEIADEILRKVIMDQHPQIFEHQKAIVKLEKELLKTL